jgi:hypothetical protein
MSIRWIPLLAAVALGIPGSAAAQEAWDYQGTLYGWFPGVTTTVETPFGEVEGEVSFDEILETLDMAFLGAIEARKGRVSLVADLQFFDVGVEAEPPGLPFSEAEIDSQMTLLGAYATYAVIDQADLRVDVGGGLRYVDAAIDTHLVGQGTTPDASFSRDGGWTDAIIAARVRRQFNERWHGVAYADVGGFGIEDSSDLTWQAFVGGGYRINQTWSASAGYRHLVIEREFRSAPVTVEVSGPFMGFQASF